MLFNSFAFIGLFLPITLLLWFLFRSWLGLRSGLFLLVAASLLFYAIWDVRYLALLLTSIFVNFWLGGRILSARAKVSDTLAKRWLIAGVSFNLIVLGYFKYAYFIASNVAYFFDTAPPFAQIVLPLAISFVTFQKIAYLVDCRRGLVQRHDLLNYMFFVSFFPQLIAGPIVHHQPLIAQTDIKRNPLFFQPAAIATGISFFAIGLFKKVVLADSLARYASPVFELSRHVAPDTQAAWQAMLAYTLQLYFDFSGYSDMAIGLALLFGFKLPLNFLSPYKSRSITDFWRRWHMTLSIFLRDYLYIPLGGNQHGALMRARNLLLTMLLGGLWHGAGWNFLLWGFFHACLLFIHQIWRAILCRRPGFSAIWKRVPGSALTAITFLFIGLGWVLFRADDLPTALRFYTALFNPLPGTHFPTLAWPSFGQLLEAFVSASPEAGWWWVAIGLAIVMKAPNTSQLLSYDPTPNILCKTNPGVAIGLLAGGGLWLALKWMAVRPSTEFLYFNF